MWVFVVAHILVYKIKRWCIANECTALSFPTGFAEPTFEFAEHACVASR